MRKIWCTFGITGGRSERRIDRKLRRIAKRFHIKVPQGYNERIDKLLAELPADEPQQEPVVVTVQPERRQRNRHMMIMKPVCVIIAICILAGYGTVSNSSSDLDTRMEEMPDTEIEEFNEMVQTEEVHADTYTREFTDIERGRMDALKMKYVSSGGYPAGKLLILNTVSEWDGQTPAFAVQTSTFCVPNRTLMDEELLEFMEFMYKREHSVEVMNSTEAEEVEDVSDEVEETVLDEAADIVKETLGLDVSENECYVQHIGFDTEYMITYKEQNQNICQVVVNIESGDVLEVSDVSLRIYEDTEYNESYIDESLKQVLGCVSSGRWKKAEVKHVTAEYYINEDSGVIWDGNIRYLVELEDGSSYSFSYSCAKQRLAGISYVKKKIGLEEWYGMDNLICEKMNLSRKIQIIK